VSSISSIDPASSTILATHAIPVAYDEPPPLDVSMQPPLSVAQVSSTLPVATLPIVPCVVSSTVSPLSFLERNRLRTFATTPPPRSPICTTEKVPTLLCKNVSIASELPYLLFTDTCLASTSFPLASSSSWETFLTFINRGEVDLGFGMIQLGQYEDEEAYSGPP
jgi:hypothetical protein